MHPFDMKTVVFAKHAQHVVLIHFPIALVMIGVLFSSVSRIVLPTILKAGSDWWDARSVGYPRNKPAPTSA